MKPTLLKKQELKRMKAKKDIDIEAEDLSEQLRGMFLKNNIKGKT